MEEILKKTPIAHDFQKGAYGRLLKVRVSMMRNYSLNDIMFIHE